MNLKWIIPAVLSFSLCGCAAPSIHPVYTLESLTQDSGLLGEWATDVPTVTRVVVSEGPDGRYLGALTIHQNAEIKAALALEVSLTRIGEDEYVDLYLAKPDRERLAAKYGFLALPVHQFMKIHREGDVLWVWTFNPEWMRRAGSESAFSSDVLPIGGRDVAVVTADSRSLRGFLLAHAHDSGALSAPMIFRRVGPLPGAGRVPIDPDARQ